jgi:phytoene dehydrogenase-like protein
MAVDHVIIGSGINGLVAASLLALKGDRVLVLEREAICRAVPAHRGDLALPGFHHDVMAATFVLFMTSPAGAGAWPASGAAWAGLLPHAAPDRRAAPGWVGRGADDRSAANVARWRRWRRRRRGLCRGCGRRRGRRAVPVRAAGRQRLWSWPTGQAAVRAGAQARACAGWPAWFGQALDPARGWLESTYRSPGAQALFAPWVLHCGPDGRRRLFRPDGQGHRLRAGGGGAPIAKGGAGQAAQAFRALIEEKGGIRSAAGADVDRSRPRWPGHRRRLAGGERDRLPLGPGLGRAGAACTTGCWRA